MDRILTVIAKDHIYDYTPAEHNDKIFQYMRKSENNNNGCLRFCHELTNHVFHERGEVPNSAYDATLYAWRNNLRKHGEKLDLLGLVAMCDMLDIDCVFQLKGENETRREFSITRACRREDFSEQRNFNVIMAYETDAGSHAVLYAQTNFMKPEPFPAGYIVAVQEDEINMCRFLIDKPMGGLTETHALLAQTNMIRQGCGQDTLQDGPHLVDFNPQGHDPGEYAQLMSLNNISNVVRELYGQPPLETSKAQADQSMYEVEFHDKEPEILHVDLVHNTLADRIEIANMRFSTVNDHESEDEDEPAMSRLDSNLPVAHMSRIETSRVHDAAFLWDSGATRTIIGRGDMYQRLINDFEVAYHNKKQQVMAESDMQLKRKLEEGSLIKVTVASGQEVLGKQIDRVDIKVKATDIKAPVPGEAKVETVNLSLLNPILSKDILTDVISESYFMETNKDFTLITQGTEKYLVFGDVTILVKEKNGQAPIKIPLRYEDGAHYLDPHAVVRNRNNVNWQDQPASDHSLTQNQPDTATSASVHMVRISDTSTSVGSGTHAASNLPQSYIQMATASKIYVPADRLEPYANISDADQGCDEAEKQEEAVRIRDSPVYLDHKRALKHIHDVYENPSSTLSDCKVATEALAKAVNELNAWLFKYKQQYRAMGMDTRRSSRLTSNSQSSNNSQPQSQTLNNKSRSHTRHNTPKESQPEQASDQSRTCSDDTSSAGEPLRPRSVLRGPERAESHKKWRVTFEDKLTSSRHKSIDKEKAQKNATRKHATRSSNQAAAKAKQGRRPLPEPNGAPTIESEGEDDDVPNSKPELYDPDNVINKDKEPSVTVVTNGKASLEPAAKKAPQDSNDIQSDSSDSEEELTYEFKHPSH